MPRDSNKTPITRFTYDWLIRFAELYPFDAIEHYIGETEPTGPYDYYKTKYAAISPMFTALIIRYAPHVFNVANLYIKRDKFSRCTLHSLFPTIEHDPSASKQLTIFICERFLFVELTPGVITRFKNNRIFFYGKNREFEVRFDESKHPVTPKLEPTELKYLLQLCEHDTSIDFEAKLTETLMFSEIWPLIAQCENITLRLENLVYDENTADVLRANRFFPDNISLWWINLPDAEVLKIFEFILSLPVLTRSLHIRFVQQRQKSLSDAITKKYVDAGVPNMRIEEPTTNTFNTIEFIKNDSLCFY